MSILIKGMDMPRSCHSCCFFGQAYIWESDFDGYTKSFCKRTGSQTFDYVENFLPNCPLVPVPPHGRLIDADALRAKMYHEAFETDSPMQKWDSGCWIRYKMFERMEEAASTIIPAEPPKEEQS